jgi:glycosyltransferase involved in cell wall biosynthesis
MSPFVSVLMTAFNREKYVEEAIQSVLKSSYSNFELIIVDDCSTDNTVSIIQSYEKNDRRIKVFINDTTLGDYPNRAKAVSHATGKYIKFVDSDDLIYPHTLEKMVEAMERYPEAAMGISQITVESIESFPKLTFPEITYKQHFYGDGILRYGPTGTIINREAYNQLGGFSHKRYIADTEFWLKLAAIYPIIKLEPGLVFWRSHSEQEYYYGINSNAYIAAAYKAYRNALNAENCPLQKQDIKRITKRLQWKQARDILSVGFKKKNIKEAYEIYKKSDINFLILLSGILPYKIMRSRF